MARGVDKAVRLFERGLLIPSAEALRNARMDAASRHDHDTVAEADHVADQMRAHLDPNELKFFNAVLERGKTAVDSQEVDVSPIGLGLALIGAVAMLVAVFLPYADPKSFARVEENTLIQHGGGWEFIVIAVSAR